MTKRTTTTISTTPTTTTTTTPAGRECHPDIIGDGICDENCNNIDFNGHDYNQYDNGDCCPEEIDERDFYYNGYNCN